MVLYGLLVFITVCVCVRLVINVCLVWFIVRCCKCCLKCVWCVSVFFVCDCVLVWFNVFAWFVCALMCDVVWCVWCCLGSCLFVFLGCVVLLCLNVCVVWDVLCDVVWCVFVFWFCLRVLVRVSSKVLVRGVRGLSTGVVWLVVVAFFAFLTCVFCAWYFMCLCAPFVVYCVVLHGLFYLFVCPPVVNVCVDCDCLCVVAWFVCCEQFLVCLRVFNAFVCCVCEFKCDVICFVMA